ncbi:MAG: DUF4012 domain-containing protein [Planctomycetes bacterium]|nr:DUF4012 domain-containing protein [Planctomycetota bacterium]
MPFKLYAYYKFVSTDVEAKVMRESQAGLTDLMLASEAAAQLDFAKASLRFTKAGENFISAHKELNHISNILLTLASFSGDAKMKLAAESKKILEVGVIVSNLGNNLSATVSNIMSDVKEGKIISAIDTFTFFSQKSLKDLDDLNGLLEKISVNNLPEQYQNKFITLKSKTNVVKKALLEFTDLSEAIKIFLGASQNKRYLLVFQNNNELRASGGFLGSYALIDFKEGNIKNIEIPEGGSYDTEGGLKVLVRSPEPLHLVSPIWYFWDSNWWPDWRLSAQNIMWFYEKSGGSTVDGVISITPTVLERLLEITGPIDLNEQYGVVVSADNFWEIVQGIVEQKGNEVSGYDPKKPKKIIKDLMDKMMLELPKKLNSNNIAKLLLALDKSLLEKDILFYFTDENLQKEISDRNWGGEMQPEDFDYLQVVHTNIAGGKSDRVMKENINQDIEIQSDGSIVKTLTIKREHQGNKQDLYTGVRNVDWLRVYVPEGSKLIEANGFERPNDIYFKSADEATVSNDYVENTENRAIIDSLSGTKSYQENNKTVFANWVMIDPGKTGIVTLKYKLPFSIFEAVKKEKADDWLSKVKEVFSAKGQNVLSYSLLWQKQPGSPESSISSNLKINNGLSVFWQQAGSFHSKDYDWMVKDNLDSDKYWVVLLAK